MKNEFGVFAMSADFLPVGVRSFTCVQCETDQYLMIESLQALNPTLDGWVMAEYSCGQCESFYAHEVSSNALADYLSEVEAPLGVLQVAQQYVHCGEPMVEGDMKLTGIQAPQGDGQENIGAVVLQTVLLRCRCGFQMSIPT